MQNIFFQSFILFLNFWQYNTFKEIFLSITLYFFRFFFKFCLDFVKHFFLKILIFIIFNKFLIYFLNFLNISYLFKNFYYIFNILKFHILFCLYFFLYLYSKKAAYAKKQTVKIFFESNTRTKQIFHCIPQYATQPNESMSM